MKGVCRKSQMRPLGVVGCRHRAVYLYPDWEWRTITPPTPCTTTRIAPFTWLKRVGLSQVSKEWRFTFFSRAERICAQGLAVAAALDGDRESTDMSCTPFRRLHSVLGGPERGAGRMDLDHGASGAVGICFRFNCDKATCQRLPVISCSAKATAELVSAACAVGLRLSGEVFGY